MRYCINIDGERNIMVLFCTNDDRPADPAVLEVDEVLWRSVPTDIWWEDHSPRYRMLADLTFVENAESAGEE
jgi:hypothetical protein